MKECWINVYDNYGYGAFWDHRVGNGRWKIIYRLHVKLKDKPGLSREYLWAFDDWLYRYKTNVSSAHG